MGFNHGLGSVVTALLDEGLVLETLTELDWSPYDIFPDMEEVAPGRFRMRRFGRNLPLVYGLSVRTATRPGERRRGARAASAAAR